jgi:hypothetical protein
MKKFSMLFISMVIATFLTNSSFAQEQQDTASTIHKIIKQNGAAFVGKILSQDSREILMESVEIGLVYIPLHEVREIVEVPSGTEVLNGDLFATRYFLTTNGFPVKKGDNYVQWNLFGPDFQFGIADHFGVGIMTSWVGMPIIGTAKYSLNLGKNLSGGLGFLGGTGSWAFPEYGLLLPFGFLTLGNKSYNINVSAGYGAIFMERTETVFTIQNIPSDYSTNTYTIVDKTINDSEGRFLWSLAGMIRMNSKFSFVFDSFFMVKGKDRTRQMLHDNYNPNTNMATYSIVTETEKANPLFVLAPGLRFQANERSSFQFGFTGLHFDGEFVPVPIPLVQWFRKI